MIIDQDSTNSGREPDRPQENLMTDQTEAKPENADVERTDAEKVKRQAPSDPPGDAKPNEGIRPDQLTTENDGGAEG